MKSVLSWVWSGIEFLIVVYVIIITALLLSRNNYGYTQIGDYTLNNIDLFDERNIANTKKGDLLIVQNGNDIKEGDLIYYYIAYNDNYMMRTDYVSKVEKDDFSAIYTVKDDKGVEYNVPSAKVVGKEAAIKKNLGGILSVLESRLGFLFLVLLPVMVVFIYQIYDFVVTIREEKELLEEEKKEAIKAKKLEEKKTETKKKDDDIEIL